MSSPTTTPSHSWRDIVLTALAPSVWGSTYIITTQLLPPNHPFTAATIRVLPVGIIMLLMTRALPKGQWWWKLVVLGLLNLGFFQALLFVSAYRLPGGVAATVGAIQPLVVVLFTWLIWQTQHSRTAWLAAIAGFVGVALLVLGPAARLDAIGVVAAFLGAVSMALGTIMTKRWASPLSLIATTGWQLTFGGLFLLPLAWWVETPLTHLTTSNIIGYGYLCVIGSALTYALWFRGIKRLTPSSASILGLLSPVVATLLGFIILQQHLTLVQLVGMAMVLGSVWLGQRQNSKIAAAPVMQQARR